MVHAGYIVDGCSFHDSRKPHFHGTLCLHDQEPLLCESVTIALGRKAHLDLDECLCGKHPTNLVERVRLLRATCMNQKNDGSNCEANDRKAQEDLEHGSSKRSINQQFLHT